MMRSLGRNEGELEVSEASLLVRSPVMSQVVVEESSQAQLGGNSSSQEADWARSERRLMGREKSPPEENEDQHLIEEEEEEDEEGPSNNKKKAKPRRWTDAEDAALCFGVEKYGERRWKAIAARVGTRDHMQCLQRWKKVLKRGLVKDQWTREDDDVIRDAVTSVDDASQLDWNVVANKLPLRSARECRERYKYALGTLAAHRNTVGGALSPSATPASAPPSLGSSQGGGASPLDASAWQPPRRTRFYDDESPLGRGGLMTPSLVNQSSQQHSPATASFDSLLHTRSQHHFDHHHQSGTRPPSSTSGWLRSEDPQQQLRSSSSNGTPSSLPAPRRRLDDAADIEARLFRLQSIVEQSCQEILQLQELVARKKSHNTLEPPPSLQHRALQQQMHHHHHSPAGVPLTAPQQTQQQTTATTATTSDDATNDEVDDNNNNNNATQESPLPSRIVSKSPPTANAETDQQPKDAADYRPDYRGTPSEHYHRDYRRDRRGIDYPPPPRSDHQMSYYDAYAAPPPGFYPPSYAYPAHAYDAAPPDQFTCATNAPRAPPGAFH